MLCEKCENYVECIYRRMLTHLIQTTQHTFKRQLDSIQPEVIIAMTLNQEITSCSNFKEGKESLDA